MLHFRSAAVVSVVLSAMACSSSGGGGGACPPDAGTCLPAGGAGNTGGFGNTGNGGVGNTGTGGSGNSATGGFGNGGSGGVGNGGSGGVGNGGSGGGGTGATGGSGPNPNLGRQCVTQAECGTGLTCITASSGAFAGEGPAKGMCTADCTVDPNVCTDLDPTGICLDFGQGTSFCMEGCSFGPDTSTQFDPNKCHGRQEVACTALLDETGNVFPACIPQCNSNADCGGLLCNPETGGCTTSAPTGLSLGTTCTVPASGGTDACTGTCTQFVNGSGANLVAMCTERCTLGASPACSWTGNGPAPAACLFVSTAILDNGGAGIGDAGSCGLLCDCNSDCKTSALVCRPWEGVNAGATEAFFQRAGFCSDPDNGDGTTNPGITSCP
jgi:hypothetical protein